MSVISMKQLLEAGVHFGHQTRRWNPKMAEYIYTERNGIYIIDLQKSVGKVDEAYKAVADIAAEGGKILFVGTKKQAQDAIATEAERCGMFYVNERWLGGIYGPATQAAVEKFQSIFGLPVTGIVDYRSCCFTDGYQRSIQSHISIDLILLHSLCPETFTASSYIPVT